MATPSPSVSRCLPCPRRESNSHGDCSPGDFESSGRGGHPNTPGVRCHTKEEGQTPDSRERGQVYPSGVGSQGHNRGTIGHPQGIPHSLAPDNPRRPLPCRGPVPPLWPATGLLWAFLLVVAPLAGQAPTRHREPLGTLDYALMGTSTAAIVGDWLTTLDMVHYRHVETNPILGPHPSQGRVNLVCGLVVLANTLAVSRLDKWNRKIVWVAVTAVEVAAIRQNWKIGLRFRLP